METPLDEFYLDIQNDGSGIYIRPDILFTKKDGKKVYQNPFPGLRPFRTSEYIFFFGRDSHVRGLTSALKNHRFLAVVGNSGSGKSSLVRAGLIPELFKKDGNKWDIAICRPGNNAIGNLAVSLSMTSILRKRDSLQEPTQIDHEKIRSGKDAIEEILRESVYGLDDIYKLINPVDAVQKNLLVIVDQFEELFRFKDVNADQPKNSDDVIGDLTPEESKEHFVNLLLKSTQRKNQDKNADAPVPSVYVVITMRSEFLGDCVRFEKLPETINKGQYLVPRLTNDELRKTIEEPLVIVDASITETLVNRLINETEQLSSTGNLDQLPLLQHVLMRIYDKATVDGKVLEERHYASDGGMKKELATHADEVYNRLGPRQKEIAQILFQTITESITGLKGGRRPTRLGVIYAIAKSKANENEIDEVIDRFRAEKVAFIMPPSNIQLRASTIIDISHESIMRNWDLLQAWTKEEEKYGQYYQMLNDRRKISQESRAQNKKVEWISEFFLEEMQKWQSSHRNCLEWANRFLTSGDERNDGAIKEEDRRIYDDNISFLNQSIAEAKKASDKQKTDERNKIKVTYLLWSLIVAIFFTIAFLFLWNQSELEKFRTQYVLDNKYWTDLLDRQENQSLVEESITRYMFYNDVDDSIVWSFKLLAEAKAMAQTNPDLSLRLALLSKSKNNPVAENWITKTVGKYQYERKFSINDRIVDLEYDAGDATRINLLTATNYYPSSSMSGKSGSVPADVVTMVPIITNPCKDCRYIGPDGQFLLELNKAEKTIRRIRKADSNDVFKFPDKKNIIGSLNNLDGLKIEISRDGKTLVIVEPGNRKTGFKSRVRMFNFEDGESIDVDSFLDDEIFHIYFFNKYKDLALLGFKKLFVRNGSSWKQFSTVHEPITWSRNDSAKAHVFSNQYGVYIVDYENLQQPDFKSFEQCKRKFQIDSRGFLTESDRLDSILIPFAVTNAAISSTGKYLAYLVQETGQDGQSNVDLQIKSIHDHEPDKTVTWPSYAPLRLVHGPGDLFLTAGSIVMGKNSENRKVMSYAYEWNAGNMKEIDISLLAQDYLTPFTFFDSARYGLFDCKTAETNRELLSCAQFYRTIFHGDNHPVFTYFPFSLREGNESRIDSISYFVLKNSFIFFERYFKSPSDTLGATSLQSYLETGLELDGIKRKPSDKSRPIEGYYNVAINRAEALEKELRKRNDARSLNNFGNALFNVRSKVPEEDRQVIDRLLHIKPDATTRK